MTAPAAALIQRPPQLREHMREHLREAHPAAQGTRADGGFAAHLERRDAPPQADRPTAAPTPANDTRTSRPATALATAPDTPDTAPPGEPAIEPAIEPATGKSLPDKRQIPVLAAGLAVQTVLSARAAAKGQAAPAEPAPAKIGPPDAEPETTAIPESASPVLAILLAAPAPALRVTAPPAVAQPRQTVMTARIVSAARSAPPMIPAKVDAPADAKTSGAKPATPGPATYSPAAPASTTAPVVSLVLEREIAAPVAAVPDSASPAVAVPAAAVPAVADPAAADARPAESQAAPRVEPSTLAALTDAQTPGRTALRKGRSETEAALPATKAPVPEITASSFALAQPAASTVPGSGEPAAPTPTPASGQPAEGIGFDALVDSIARARDDAADGAQVAVAMRHAEFGRISLRFHTDADGLSVAMTSPDPGFAPAVAAAHAAEAAASTEAAPRAAQSNSAATIAAGDSGGSQMQGGTRSGMSQRQDGQRQDGPPQHHDPRTTQRSAEPTADDKRGGIFA